jgi:hypothetical protein
MASWHDALAIYAVTVLAAVNDVNEEHRMSVQVSALADVVRNAKAAIATASDSAARLKGSADRVVQRVAEVEAMVGELNAAESELAKALGSTSNGGPPLSDTPSSSPAVLPSVSPVDGINASITAVQNANTPAA